MNVSQLRAKVVEEIQNIPEDKLTETISGQCSHSGDSVICTIGASCLKRMEITGFPSLLKLTTQ